jgi:hypothetical protein
MQFRSKHGPILDGHFDNEVPFKKNPDDSYSKEFVEGNRKRFQQLKARVRGR